MFSHQHQHLFYPLQSILSWYWQALANIASNRWQSNSILQTIPNPNSPFFEETQWWLATSCLLCKIASIEGSVQLLVGDAAPIIGQLVTHNTTHWRKAQLVAFFLWSAKIRGSAQCVGGDAGPNYWICTNWRRRGGWGVRIRKIGQQDGSGGSICRNIGQNSDRWAREGLGNICSANSYMDEQNVDFAETTLLHTHAIENSQIKPTAICWVVGN